MTGIGNRAAFDRDAGILHAKRDTNTFAVAVFDVNNLKYTNDTYGHAAGDRLIKDTADSVKDAFSAIGRCYRIGGDEFADGRNMGLDVKGETVAGQDVPAI